MLYKPNYCSNCGEKIDRIEWFPWTSRRFCEVCETDHKFYEWLPKFLLIFFGLVGIFGFGSYLKSGENQVSGSLKQTSSADIAGKPANTGNVSPNLSQPNIQAQNLKPLPESAPLKTSVAAEKPKPPTQTADKQTETVYFCGAQTKKGNPCSRRVKGGGRCWQHQGQPAMLSQAELIAVQ